MQVLMLAVQNSVHVREVGTAISGSTFFRSIGGTLGTAILGAVMTSQLTKNIETAIPGGSSIDVSAMTNAVSTIASLPAKLHDIVLVAYAGALSHIFIVAFPFMVAAFVLSLFLKEVKLSPLVGHEHPEELQRVE
ncbi:unannotated protein [freshwater metagenome]|uniref:Unannotated protein n=1 Tax=freshwater metagenome TaxID=449393 RepID=A0A6J7HRH0_9ZZZZ